MSFKGYKRHGITKETVKHIFVDAGAVYLNFNEPDERLLGATMGGNSFSIEQEIRQLELDGARGPVMGGARVINVAASIKANLYELSAENIMAAIAGSEIDQLDDIETHSSIKRKRQIVDTDYIKNVALVGTIMNTDEPIVCIIKNALATSNFTLDTTDKEENGLEVTFTAHFDPANLDEEPWEILYPKQEQEPENPED